MFHLFQDDGGMVATSMAYTSVPAKLKKTSNPELVEYFVDPVGNPACVPKLIRRGMPSGDTDKDSRKVSEKAKEGKDKDKDKDATQVRVRLEPSELER